jgi:pimeloyl-ACP methyl ester carboxylesterase
MPAIERHRARLTAGLELEYAERGSGPALVFLHGYSDAWYSFDRIMRALPRDVRALALTLRGHGDSDRPASGYRIEDFAADVVAFMDAIEVERAILVGHSMSSLVAQAVACAQPHRVSHLVLIGSATTFDNPAVRDLEQAIRELRDPVPRAFVEEFQASTVHRPIPGDVLAAIVDESLKLPASVWRDALAGILAYRPGRRLASLALPTLIAWGDRDAFCARAEQDRLHETIPSSRLTIYEDTGHAPQWEQPQRFADDLVAFVSA